MSNVMSFVTLLFVLVSMGTKVWKNIKCPTIKGSEAVIFLILQSVFSQFAVLTITASFFLMMWHRRVVVVLRAYICWHALTHRQAQLKYLNLFAKQFSYRSSILENLQLDHVTDCILRHTYNNCTFCTKSQRNVGVIVYFMFDMWYFFEMGQHSHNKMLRQRYQNQLK